ncbi:MAG TPA: glycosyltransferase family 4 protein [Chryseosolibacter sp.]
MKNEDKLRILHITPWYPNRENPLEALWIRKHIYALKGRVDQSVWHIQVKPGSKILFERTASSPWEKHRILTMPTKRWFLIELITFLYLCYFFLVRGRARSFDVINFHIAYPTLTFWRWLKPLVRKPVLIVEHWSAYHFNFGVTSRAKTKRIQRIFSDGLPVATVSKALAEDIQAFCGLRNFRCFTLPNIVDVTIYSPATAVHDDKYFFMVSQWSWPKNPLMVINAFAKWKANFPSNFKLKIAGYGNQWAAMVDRVAALEMQEYITLCGKLAPAEVAEIMKHASGFLHCSEYETFSVVCAEALCCGVPVLASRVGGIVEFVDEHNGVLIDNSERSWMGAFETFTVKSFERSKIATDARARFSEDKVGANYFAIVNEIADAVR